MLPSDDWSPQVMIVTGSRRKGWTLTRYPLGDEEWRRAEMPLSDNCLSWMEAGFSHHPDGTDGLLKEAAAEIRQLRAERDRLRECLEPGKASAIVNGMFRQAERLGFYKPTAKHALTQFVEQVEKLTAERDQLKAQLAELSNHCPKCGTKLSRYGNSSDDWECHRCQEVWVNGSHRGDNPGAALLARLAVLERVKEAAEKVSAKRISDYEEYAVDELAELDEALTDAKEGVMGDPSGAILARLATLELLAKFVLTMPDNDNSWWLESLTAKAREALAAAREGKQPEVVANTEAKLAEIKQSYRNWK